MTLFRVTLILLSSFCLTSAPAAIDQEKENKNTLAQPGFQSDYLHSRIVQYAERDVVPVKARLRFTTLIILPEEEEILDFTCGDKEYWVIDGTDNLAYIKPAKAGAQTNINLITASGRVYSFAVSEISETSDEAADLKIFIEPKEESILQSAGGKRRWVSVSEVDHYRELLEVTREEARAAREEAAKEIDAQISKFISDYPTNLCFTYRFQADKKPFRIRAIYHDDRFTYIKANPEELPAVYEVRDGKPNLVNFDFRDGTFVVSKILTDGYLAIGKKKLRFIRWEGK